MIKDELIDWLKDAYAMEMGIVTMLEGHGRDARREGYVEMADKIDEHCTQTKSQASRVEACLKSLDSDTSAGRDMFSKMSANVQTVTAKVFKDEVMKAALSDYATEYFEMAAYQAIVTAAELCGEDEIATTCRAILEEEKAMGEWIGAQLPKLTTQYLNMVEMKEDDEDS